MIVADRQLTPLGFGRTAGVTTPAIRLPSLPVDAMYAYIQADGGDLRWRDDGTDPTATVGHFLAMNDALWYVGDLHKIRFIRDTSESSDTNLHVSYYKPK
jgi:hypothetical protein